MIAGNVLQPAIVTHCTLHCVFRVKMMSKNTWQTTEQPVIHKIAENLHRLESSDGYYDLLKRGGKQFRRSCRGASKAGQVV